jgi:putative hydrolase
MSTPPPSDNQPANDSPDDLPPDPFGHGDPFDTSAHPSSGAGLGAGLGGLLGPMMGDLSKLFAQQRQNGWEQTRQFATLRATGERQPDGAVVPLDRIRLEELVAIVEPHVVTATGLETAGAKGIKVEAVTRAQWATNFLDRHRTILEPALASTSTATNGSSDASSDAEQNMIANMMNMLGPSMMAMQIGAMAGQLSYRYLASGDLPLPRSGGDVITFIPGNITSFADAWSLPIDSLRIRVAIDELILHVVTRTPHISSTLQKLMAQHVAGFRIDGASIMERFTDMASLDPSEMQNQMEALSSIAASAPTAAQLTAAAQLQRITSLVRGYVDHVGNVLSTQMLGGDTRVSEALRRRGFESDDATKMLASILGAEVNQEQQERGAAFVKGVFDRVDDNGPASLAKLWTSDANLPTDAELAAPGLWLARLEYS